MEAEGWQTLHALVARYHKGTPDDLLKYLPEDDRVHWKSEAKGNITFDSIVTSAETVFCSMDPSWLQAPLQKAPEKLQHLILSALPPKYKAALSASQELSEKETPLSDPVRLFILELFKRVYASDLAPISSNTTLGKLSPLLTLDKAQLIELFSLLGLWDLAEDIKRIIDKKKLQQIFKCLSVKQQQIVKMCLRSHDRLSPPPIGIDRWDRSCESLHRLLHKRGISRFGKALSGHPLPTIRMFCRRLDTGRAKLLMSYTSRQEISDVSGPAVMQVLNLVKQIEKVEAPGQ